MSRLARDGTAESVSRDQIIIRRELGQGNIHFFPVQLTTSRIGGNLTRMIHTLLYNISMRDDHTYILVGA